MSRVLPVFENGFTEAGHLILKIYLLDETKVDLGDATLLQRRENGPPNKIELHPKTWTLIINFIRTLPTFIRTCADECGNPIP